MPNKKVVQVKYTYERRHVAKTKPSQASNSELFPSRKEYELNMEMSIMLKYKYHFMNKVIFSTKKS